MRFRWRPRARTLLGALVLAGLTWLLASWRHDSVEARPHRDRPPSGRGKARGQSKLAPDSPWASREACTRALGHGGAQRAAGVARIGAWNLHWFPDGGPGEAGANEGTDLDWLACSIAWLRVDVLAVEEIKRPPRGVAGLAELRQKLDQLTGGHWQAILDECPKASNMHLGLLYDERRVKLDSSAIIGAFNSHGRPCEHQLRPGVAGYFRFPGGLDLSVVAAHLKSGTDTRAIESRVTSFAAFEGAALAEWLRNGDADVLFVGDMNSMGCAECAPVVSPDAERSRIDALFASAKLPLLRLPSDPGCSHHFDGEGVLLDWMAKSDLAELPAGARVTVSGVCGELGCARSRVKHAALERLSDHCPIWLDVPDVERDL